MLASCLEIESLHELREYVNETICNYQNLEIGAYEMTQRLLVRGDKACGIYFCVHGPRQVKFSAIWETDRNTVLFYGSNGERYLKTQLIKAPTLAETELFAA